MGVSCLPIRELEKAWTKSGAILTTRIRGEYWMYWLGTAQTKRIRWGFRVEGFASLDRVTETPVLRGGLANSIHALLNPARHRF